MHCSPYDMSTMFPVRETILVLCDATDHTVTQRHIVMHVPVDIDGRETLVASNDPARPSQHAIESER